MRRTMLSTLAAASVLLLAAPAATADPVNAKNALVLTVNCPTSPQPLSVVVNGNGEWSPGHILGSTAVFIPQSLNLTFSFTPTGGTTQTDTEVASKPHEHGDLVTCTIPAGPNTFTSPEGTFSISGTVTGFATPAS